jgi:hypothetical protein
MLPHTSQNNSQKHAWNYFHNLLQNKFQHSKMLLRCLGMFQNVLWECAVVVKCFGNDSDHVLKAFGAVVERVCKYFRVWGGDTPCKNLASARFARRFPFIFAKYCKNLEKISSARVARREFPIITTGVVPQLTHGKDACCNAARSIFGAEKQGGGKDRDKLQGGGGKDSDKLGAGFALEMHLGAESMLRCCTIFTTPINKGVVKIVTSREEGW